MKRRKCSKCGRRIPYNSGSFTLDIKKKEYICDECNDFMEVKNFDK
jgi:DNA-directed RNA polymerase subunit RPC12/RpoP